MGRVILLDASQGDLTDLIQFAEATTRNIPSTASAARSRSGSRARINAAAAASPRTSERHRR